MRVLIVLYLLLVGLAAVLAQMLLPAHSRFLSAIGFGSALIPLVVVYASLELADERAPILAALLGLLLDLASSHHLGVSALLLGGLSTLIVSQAHRREAHQWIFRLTFVLIGSFAYLLADYMVFLAETSQWRWPLDVWTKITFASLFNLILTPFFFLLIGLPPRLCGWKPTYELNERFRAYA